MDKIDYYNPELEGTSFDDGRMMGNVMERRKFSQFSRLIRLNDQITFTVENVRIIRVKYEIMRYLGALRIPAKLSKFIFYNYEKFHGFFPKFSKLGSSKLIPVALYITCLQRGFFMTKHEIINVSEFTKTQFNKTLIRVLQYDHALQQWIVSDKFRKKYILSFFRNMLNHFNHSLGIMTYVNKIFPKFFEKYKNLSNTNILIGLYLIVGLKHPSMEYIRGVHVCTFLGFSPCSFYQRKKVFLHG